MRSRQAPGGEAKTLTEILSWLALFQVPTVVSFVAAVFIVVLAHELGHYLGARVCGIVAKEVAVGFGPRIAMSRDRHGTVWSVRCVPLGGFVRLPDSVMPYASIEGSPSPASGDRLGESAEPASLRGFEATAETQGRVAKQGESAERAPLTHRAIITAAGPLASFLLGVLIFAAFAMWNGVVTQRAVIGQLKSLPGPTSELQSGDRILAVDGAPVDDLMSLYLLPVEGGGGGSNVIYTIERGEDRLDIAGPPLRPAAIHTVHLSSAASEAGLKQGDVVTAIDGEEVRDFADIVRHVERSGERTMRFEIWRDGAVFNRDIAPWVTEFPGPGGEIERRSMIGVSGGLFFTPETYTPGPFEGGLIGVRHAWRIVTGSLQGMYDIVAANVSTCNMHGVIRIAQVSEEAASQGLGSFLNLIGVFSVAIGVLQLLPIPVLDGGHLVFMAYEAAAGRPLRSETIRWALGIGLALLLALFAFTIVNDLAC